MNRDLFTASASGAPSGSVPPQPPGGVGADVGNGAGEPEDAVARRARRGHVQRVVVADDDPARGRQADVELAVADLLAVEGREPDDELAARRPLDLVAEVGGDHPAVATARRSRSCRGRPGSWARGGPTWVADRSPTRSPSISKIPHPGVRSGWPVSSPAIRRCGSSGKKQSWPLMSMPSGSSAAVGMTVCFSNGSVPHVGVEVVALGAEHDGRPVVRVVSSWRCRRRRRRCRHRRRRRCRPRRRRSAAARADAS